MAEIIGVAASIIQVAGAGLKISKELYQYVDGVATADRRIRNIATEIRITSEVLEQLGDVFKQDEKSHVISKKAIKTAREAMKECSDVFLEIQVMLGKGSKGRFGRLMMPFRDTKIEVLQRHIDKLKVALNLLLQVLTFGHLLSSQKVSLEAQEKHRGEIRQLLENQKLSTKRYEESLRSYSISDGSTNVEGDRGLDMDDISPIQSNEIPVAAASIGPSMTSETLAECVQHVRKLLEHIEALQEALSSQKDGDDHSQHHQNLIGSYFLARDHLDSVLSDNTKGLSTSNMDPSGQTGSVQTALTSVLDVEQVKSSQHDLKPSHKLPKHGARTAPPLIVTQQGQAPEHLARHPPRPSAAPVPSRLNDWASEDSKTDFSSEEGQYEHSLRYPRKDTRLMPPPKVKSKRSKTVGTSRPATMPHDRKQLTILGHDTPSSYESSVVPERNSRRRAPSSTSQPDVSQRRNQTTYNVQSDQDRASSRVRCSTSRTSGGRAGAPQRHTLEERHKTERRHPDRESRLVHASALFDQDRKEMDTRDNAMENTRVQHSDYDPYGQYHTAAKRGSRMTDNPFTPSASVSSPSVASQDPWDLRNEPENRPSFRQGTSTQLPRRQRPTTHTDQHDHTQPKLRRTKSKKTKKGGPTTLQNFYSSSDPRLGHSTTGAMYAPYPIPAHDHGQPSPGYLSVPQYHQIPTMIPQTSPYMIPHAQASGHYPQQYYSSHMSSPVASQTRPAVHSRNSSNYGSQRSDPAPIILQPSQPSHGPSYRYGSQSPYLRSLAPLQCQEDVYESSDAEQTDDSSFNHNFNGEAEEQRKTATTNKEGQQTEKRGKAAEKDQDAMLSKLEILRISKAEESAQAMAATREAKQRKTESAAEEYRKDGNEESRLIGDLGSDSDLTSTEPNARSRRLQRQMAESRELMEARAERERGLQGDELERREELIKRKLELKYTNDKEARGADEYADRIGYPEKRNREHEKRVQAMEQERERIIRENRAKSGKAADEKHARILESTNAVCSIGVNFIEQQYSDNGRKDKVHTVARPESRSDFQHNRDDTSYSEGSPDTSDTINVSDERVFPSRTRKASTSPISPIGGVASPAYSQCSPAYSPCSSTESLRKHINEDEVEVEHKDEDEDEVNALLREWTTVLG